MAELVSEHVDAFVARLQDDFYVEPTTVSQAVERRQPFNLIHLDTMVKVDIFLPDARPFDQQELHRAGRSDWTWRKIRDRFR